MSYRDQQDNLIRTKPDCASADATCITVAAVAQPARRRVASSTERLRLRQLTWTLGLLGVILIGQANEFSLAYLGNGRLFSVPALALSIITLALGLQLNPRPRIGWPLGLLIAGMIYSVVIGALVSAPTVSLPSLVDGIARLTRPLLAMICIYVGIQAVARHNRLHLLANTFTITALAIVGYQILAYLLGHQPTIRPTVPYDQTFRYSGVFADPNVAAGFCVLLICLGVLSTLPRTVKAALPTIALAGVLVTFSRGGLVTFAAVVATNVIVGSRKGRLGFLLLLAATAAFVLLAVPWMGENGLLPLRASRHLLTLYELVSGQGELSDNSRGRLLASALLAIEQKPILGYGYGEYMTILGQGPHNMFTQFALLAGVPATLLYTSSLAALLAVGLRQRQSARGRFAITVAVWVAVMGLSLHTILDDKFSILVIVMACAATSISPPPEQPNATPRGRHGSTQRRTRETLAHVR